MRLSRWIQATAWLLLTACTSTSDTSPAQGGRLQRILEGPTSAELKDVGFVRFNEKGLKIESDYLGMHQKFAYDDRDSLLRVTDVDANGVESKAESRTYDVQGYIIADSFFSGSTLTLDVQFDYDLAKNLISKTSRSKSGGETRHTYHYKDQRRSGETRTDPSGDPIEIQYTYDDNGRISKADYNSPNPESHYSETFYYDQSGRLSNKEERAGKSQDITYKRYWAYDPHGRLVETFCNPEDGKGCIGKVEYVYSQAGDLMSKKEYAAGQVILETEYRWEEQ